MFHLEEGWNFLFTEDPGTSIIEKKDSPEGYMKVLITTDWYRPVINGVVTSVLNLERELRWVAAALDILGCPGVLHTG